MDLIGTFAILSNKPSTYYPKTALAPCFVRNTFVELRQLKDYVQISIVQTWQSTAITLN